MAGELKRISKIAVHRPRLVPRIRAWLAGHGEGVLVENEEEARLLLRLLMPGKDRAGAFHPSGITQCKRAQIFGYEDAPVDPGFTHGAILQNIFNDGTWRHARWQLMLTKMGVLDAVEVPVAIERYRLTGSMDGQGSDDQGPFFLELKGTSIGLSSIEAEGPSEPYRIQVNAYLMASGLPEAIMLYEHKGYNDFIEVTIKPDNKSQDFIETVLTEVNHHVDNGTLPRILHGCKRQQGDAWEGCPYRVHCLATGERA